MRTIDKRRCIVCGLCETECPQGAVQVVYVNGREAKREVQLDLCVDCGECEGFCPEGAIKRID